LKLLLLLRRANFFLERVAIRESHDDGILLFFSGLHDLTAFDHGIGREKGHLPGLDLAIGAHDSQTEEESATEMILSSATCS